MIEAFPCLPGWPAAGKRPLAASGRKGRKMRRRRRRRRRRKRRRERGRWREERGGRRRPGGALDGEEQTGVSP